jgi:hypothetical protein
MRDAEMNVTPEHCCSHSIRHSIKPRTYQA